MTGIPKKWPRAREWGIGVVLRCIIYRFTLNIIVFLIENNEKMAPQRGFEPPTCRLGGGCSIRLSYRGVMGAIILTDSPVSGVVRPR